MDAALRLFNIAKRSDGYIWHFDGTALSTADAQHLAATQDNPRRLTTLSMWTSAEALHAYTFNTLHGRFWARRAEWFQASDSAPMVLWRIPADQRTTLAQGEQRLAHLNQHGDTEIAFGWNALGIARPQH